MSKLVGQFWSRRRPLAAGLVGVGLCHLFGTSGCEEVKFSSGAMDGLANEMGLFLQKTNIIRDYLEDINEEPAPRMFWPKEIWQRYGTKLEDFKEPQNRWEHTLQWARAGNAGARAIR